MQQVGSAAFSDTCLPIHHQILLQSQRVLAMTEHGERHTRFALHVLDFLPDAHMCADKLVVLNTHPDDRHLRAAVQVDGGQVGKRSTRNKLLNRRGDDHSTSRYLRRADATYCNGWLPQ